MFRDNLFGLITFTMIGHLAYALANETLKPLIHNSESKEISFELMCKSLYLNEFGIINVNSIIKRYEELITDNNVFAAKLIKLMVFEHYYNFGSVNFKDRQKIWDKMGFNKQQRINALLKE